MDLYLYMHLKVSYKSALKHLVYTVLTAVLLLLPSQSAFANNSCAQLFNSVPIRDTDNYLTEPRQFGYIKKGFILDPQYKVEIPDQSDIKNQCNLDTCHLHSWASKLEHDYKAANNEDIKISTHYLSISHWIRRSLELIDASSGDQVNIQLGANVYASRRSILNSGIIPDEVWTGSRDFQSNPLSSRITEYVKNIVARAKWEINRQTDPIKTQKIRELAKYKF